MAAEVHQFTATIPAGTPKSSLAVVEMPLPLYEIESVDIEVPPGPSGLMGFYLALSGQQWIPWEAGEFLVWDDRFDSWMLNDQPTSSGWEVHGYNLDSYDHDVVVRFHLNVVGPPAFVAAPSITFLTTGLAAEVMATL